MEHLLARLEVDSACVVKRLTSLLRNSYMPAEKPSQEQLSRCVTLIQDNPNAARRFYHNIAKSHLSVAQTGECTGSGGRCQNVTRYVIYTYMDMLTTVTFESKAGRIAGVSLCLYDGSAVSRVCFRQVHGGCVPLYLATCA